MVEVDRDLVSFELEFGEVLYEMYWVYKIVHRAPCPKRERMTHDAGRVFSNVRKLRRCCCCCFTHCFLRLNKPDFYSKIKSNKTNLRLGMAAFALL